MEGSEYPLREYWDQKLTNLSIISQLPLPSEEGTGHVDVAVVDEEFERFAPSGKYLNLPV